MTSSPVARLRCVDRQEIFSFGVADSPEVIVRNLLHGRVIGIVRGVVAEFMNGDLWKVTGFLDEPGNEYGALYQTSRHRRFDVQRMDPVPGWLIPFTDIAFCRAAAEPPQEPIDLGESVTMGGGVAESGGSE